MKQLSKMSIEMLFSAHTMSHNELVIGREIQNIIFASIPWIGREGRYKERISSVGDAKIEYIHRDINEIKRWVYDNIR